MVAQDRAACLVFPDVGDPGFELEEVESSTGLGPTPHVRNTPCRSVNARLLCDGRRHAVCVNRGENDMRKPTRKMHTIVCRASASHEV